MNIDKLMDHFEAFLIWLAIGMLFQSILELLK